MNHRAHWLAASLGGVIFGTFMCVGGVWAQEAPLYGGPHISNPGAVSPGEVQRRERIHEEYCRKQPGGGCIMGKTFTSEQLKQEQEARRYRGPYVPPEPGHLTDCHQDPNNPEKPICVHK